MTDDTRPFLIGAGHVAGNVREGQQGNIKSIAETDKAGSLVGSVDIQNAGSELRVVGNHPDRLAHNSDEGHQHVFCPQFVGFKNFVVVRYGHDHLLHIITACRLVGNHAIQFRAFPVRAVRTIHPGQGAMTAVRQIGQ